jgi:hypothetical protein
LCELRESGLSGSAAPALTYVAKLYQSDAINIRGLTIVSFVHSPYLC